MSRLTFTGRGSNTTRKTARGTRARPNHGRLRLYWTMGCGRACSKRCGCARDLAREGGRGDLIWHRCNLLDAADQAALVEAVRPDIVLHLAWYVEHARFWQAEENLDWVAATAAMIKICKRCGVRRFVGVGTCFEYDWPADGDCDEAATPIRPSTLYGVTKDVVRRLAEGADFPSFAWARIFHLFGPFEPHQRLVASIARQLVRGQPAATSSGFAVRDFMDVRDAGTALARLALSDVQGAVNVSTGEGQGIRSVASRLAHISGRPDLLTIDPTLDRPHEPPRIVGSARRLTDEVGFTREFDLDRGLAEAYDWWRTQCRIDP